MAKVFPKYPIYVPSKGRPDVKLTAHFLREEGVPYKIVVEPGEYDLYASKWGEARLLVLPHDKYKLFNARNWIKAHAIANGHERHWQVDDNCYRVYRFHKGRRLPVHSGVAFRTVEDFTDRYENIAISGMNYEMFGVGKQPPYHLNARVYSCTLVNNNIPHRWRLEYNDDTDMCLQVLSDGWCTVLVNAFLIMKRRTMKVKGGNTTELYMGDGRLKMARQLERMWPGVVSTKRRFHRAQHAIKNNWRNFDTPLKLKDGVDLASLREQGPNEYGMRLKEVAPVQDERLKQYMAEVAGEDNSSVG